MRTALHHAGRATLLATLLFAGFAAGDEPSEPAKFDPDFAYVTPDAQLFYTVRVADALASEPGQKTLAMLEKLADASGENPLKQLKAMEEKAGLKLSDVERLTIVASNLQNKELWVVVRTTKDVDKTKILALLDKPEEKTASGKTYFWQKKDDIGIHFVSTRLVLIAPERGMERCIGLTGKDRPRGMLAPALAQASGNRYQLFAAADVWNALPVEVHEHLTQAAKGGGPEAELAEAGLKMRMLTYSYRVSQGKKIELRVAGEFRNADAARRMAAVVDRFLLEARKTLKEMIKELPPEAATLVDALNQLKPVQTDNVLAMQLEIDADVLYGALLGAVQKVRDAAARAQTQDHFHNILLAFHNHEAANGAFPLPANRDKAGKPLLSWRVHILPYIEEDALYKQFKLDEPWDSPNNIKLLEKMPKLYEVPFLPPAKAGHTHCQVFTGPNTCFPNDKNARRGMTLAQLAAGDGTANTILLSTAAKAVPWTAPEDIVIDKEAIRAKLFLDKAVLIVGFADGSVRSLKAMITDKTLRALITPNGGENVDPDEEKGREK